MVGLLFAPARGAPGGEAPTGARVVITQQENGTVDEDPVTCDGTVHGHVVFRRPVVGAHDLVALWVRPDGRPQDQATVRINYPAPGRRTAQVWLRFDGRQGGALSPVESDGANPSFDGEWRLTLTLDGRPLVERTFRVKC